MSKNAVKSENDSMKNGLNSPFLAKLFYGLLLAINVHSANSLAVVADSSSQPPKLDPVSVECRDIGYSSTLNYGWIYWEPISKGYNGFYTMVDEAIIDGVKIYPEYKGKYCPKGSETRELTECLFIFEAYNQKPNGNFDHEKEKIVFDFTKHKLIRSTSRNSYKDSIESDLPVICNSLAESFANREKSLNQLFPKN